MDNNELTDLVMWITSRGFDMELKSTQLGVSAEIKQKGKSICYTSQRSAENAASDAKSFLMFYKGAR